MSKQNGRDTALSLLAAWRRNGPNADDLLAAQRDREPVRAPRDGALTTELFYGCLRWMRALDWFIARQAAGRPRPLVRQILRLSLYQCLFLNRTPNRAIAAEAARLATGRALGSVGLVNAVVRRWLDRRPLLPAELSELQKRTPAVGWSHPSSLVRRWRRQWGPEGLAELCAWNNSRPPITIRVRDGRSRQSMLEQLQAHDVAATPSPIDPRFLRLDAPIARLLEATPWKEGDLYVQDESTALPVDLLDPAPGSRVLDVCAAPGGKTALLADRVGVTGSVTAVDPDPRRLGRLRSNMERLRLGGVVACVQADARDKPADPDPFDAVLADVPCTNTGVLRRRPDARWRFGPVALGTLVELQAAILAAAAERVRPGGSLVYATCSIEPEENAGQVERFLGEHSGFECEQDVARTPPAAGHDGVYAARLLRYA